MQKNTLSKKAVLLLGSGAVILLLGAAAKTFLVNTSKDSASDSTPPKSTHRYSEQQMTPEAAAQMDRFKALARGLRITAAKSDEDDQSPTDSPEETKDLLLTIPRLQSENLQDNDNSDIPKTQPVDYQVRDISSRESVIDGLDRLGTKENRERIRDLLKKKQEQSAAENPTETE